MKIKKKPNRLAHSNRKSHEQVHEKKKVNQKALAKVQYPIPKKSQQKEEKGKALENPLKVKFQRNISKKL